MAGALTIRELITRYSFKTDDKPIKQLDGAVASLKGRVGALDAKIKAAFAAIAKWTVAGAAAATVAIVKMASDAEESESKFEAVFKAQAKSVREWSDEIAQGMGRSGFKLREFAAGLQDTFVPLGFARDTASALSQNLTELALDVASFQNKSEPEVIDAFTSAIVGNHEAVRSFGITLTQSKLDQKIKELRRTMPGFTSVSKEQQKALARYQIILDSTSDAHGDAIKTSGGFANQMRGLRARMERVAITLGQRLLPMATKWVNKLSAWIDQNEELITQKVGKVLDGMVVAFQAMGKVLGWVIDNWEVLSTVLAALVAGRVLAGLIGITNQIGSMASALSQVTAGAGGVTGAVGKAAGAGGKLAGALGKAANVGMALGVGWTIGKVLDDAFGLSDKLAKGIFAINEALMAPQRKARREKAVREARSTQLEQTAQRFASLRKRGVESVEGKAGGPRVKLDREGIAQLLRAQAGRLGISSEATAKMLPQLIARAQGGAPAEAPAAVGGGRSVNVAPAQINVTVPPGTQPTQAKRVADAAGAATTTAMRRTIGDVAR